MSALWDVLWTLFFGFLVFVTGCALLLAFGISWPARAAACLVILLLGLAWDRALSARAGPRG